MLMDTPLFEDRPQTSSGLKLIIALTLGVTLVLGVVFLYLDMVGALVMFGVTLLDGFLFYSVMPRSYQVYPDRLKIVLGQPWSMTIRFDNIRAIKQVDSGSAYAAGGIRFAANSRFVVEISRLRGMNVIISPSGGEVFLEQVNRQLGSYTGKR